MFKELALELAVKSLDKNSDPQLIIETAKKFLEFLENTKKDMTQKEFIESLFIISPYGGIVSLKLNEKQEKALDHINEYQNSFVVFKERQKGLSTIMNAYAVWYALKHANSCVFILTPNYNMAQYNRTAIVDMLNGKIKLKENNKHLIRFNNDSTIHSCKVYSNATRGMKIDLLLFADYEFVSHSLTNDIIPCILPQTKKTSKTIFYTSECTNNHPFQQLNYPALVV
ncbi:MAG: hypothetical protein P4L79_11000 [Legionella sp.]|uniref:hypothetical protein n=1 Tax=Legionella sp. TaxID=459 RepID=UPI002846B3FE|nr:hypothetical protein [Legionella sp.]